MAVIFYCFALAIPTGEAPPPEPQPREGVYHIRLRLDHEGDTGLISSSADAHEAMQLHKNCDRDSCPRKADAYSWLVSHGELIPDSGRL